MFKKYLSDWLHWNGLSPVCISWWLMQWFLSQKHVTVVAPIWASSKELSDGFWDYCLQNPYNNGCIYMTVMASHQCDFCNVLQCLTNCECFATLAALVWFLSSMSLHMSDKMTITCVTFVTMVALIYGFSPVCIFIWLIRWLLLGQLLLQWLHRYDFSPVCVLRWHIWLLLFEKVLSQWLHW